VLSVLQFTDSDYPYGIFKLFLQCVCSISIRWHGRQYSIKETWYNLLLSAIMESLSVICIRKYSFFALTCDSNHNLSCGNLTSVYRCNHDPVFSSFMTYHRIGDKNNTRNRNCLPLQSTWVHFWFLVGFLLVSLLFSVYGFINHLTFDIFTLFFSW